MRQRAIDDPDFATALAQGSSSVPIPQSVHVAASNTIGTFNPAEAAEDGHSSSEDEDGDPASNPSLQPSVTDKSVRTEAEEVQGTLPNTKRRWWPGHAKAAGQKNSPRPSARHGASPGDMPPGGPRADSPPAAEPSAAIGGQSRVDADKIEALTRQVNRMTSELAAVYNDKSELEDQVANYKHVLDAQKQGITFAVGGSRDQSFQIECLTSQNKFLNQELMDMRGVHTKKDETIRVLREELESGKRSLMELLQVVAEEVSTFCFFEWLADRLTSHAQDSIDQLKSRATAIVEHLFAGDLDAKPVLPNGDGGSIPQRQPSLRSRQGSRRQSVSMVRRYDKWGFPVSNDLSATYHALRNQNSVAEKRILQKWEVFLQSCVEKGMPSSKDSSEAKHLIRGGIPNQLREKVWAMTISMRTHKLRTRLSQG